MPFAASKGDGQKMLRTVFQIDLPTLATASSALWIAAKTMFSFSGGVLGTRTCSIAPGSISGVFLG